MDFEVRTKYMTLDRRNKSLHWFNLVATDERVMSPFCLEKSRPRCFIMNVSDSEFFPAVSDHQQSLLCWFPGWWLSTLMHLHPSLSLL